MADRLSNSLNDAITNVSVIYDQDGIYITKNLKTVCIHLTGYTGGEITLPASIALNKQLETVGYSYAGAGADCYYCDVIKTTTNKIQFLSKSGYVISSVTSVRASLTFMIP